MLVPKLRFKREDGLDYPKWDTMKILDFTLSHNAGIYIAKDDYGQGINIIGVGDIYDTDIIENQQYRLAPVDNQDYILEYGDLVYGESSLVPEGIARTVCVGQKGAGSAFAWHTRRYKVNKSLVDSHFLVLQINYSNTVHRHLMRVCTQTALTGITTEEYFGTKVSIPCLEEQQKIADFFSDVDEVIAESEAEVQNLEQQKKAAMQKIFSQEVRFKREDGTDYPEWEEKRLGECLKYEQPTKYIVESDKYNDNYETPVLTANKGFILGYTNEKNGIYDKGDVIIYDDFTMDMKYVSFVFKVKSSAIKMLTAINGHNLYFLYSLLCNLGLHQETHSRSYISQVEPMTVQVPHIEEQQKIADFLSAFDEAIDYAKQELEKWKELKKGLLQQMFV